MQHAQAPSCTHTSTCVCTSTCAQHPFVRAFVLPFLLFPWLRVWKWLPMRSTSLAWEQKQCGEHIITSQRKTESCLPVCLRCCIRTFSASAATAVSRGQHFLQQQSREGREQENTGGQRSKQRARYITLICVMQNQEYASAVEWIFQLFCTSIFSHCFFFGLKLAYQIQRKWKPPSLCEIKQQPITL